jgi:alkaline phosphatase
MTLSQALDNIPAGTLIKISADHGTSYFFAGTKEAFEEKADFYYNQNLKKHIEKMNKLEQDAEKAAQFTKDRFTSENDYEYNERIRSQKREIKRIETSKKTKEKRSKYIGISYFDRDVVDAFRADPIVEPITTICIKIKGHEGGKYWDLSEVEPNSDGFGYMAF